MILAGVIYVFFAYGRDEKRMPEMIEFLKKNKKCRDCGDDSQVVFRQTSNEIPKVTTMVAL